MSAPLLFIHIPKSAGSSFREQVLKPNYDYEYYNYRGIKKLWNDRNTLPAVVGGHMPFGTHLIAGSYRKYITILRDPIHRAISHYYWVLQDPGPLYPNANQFHRKLHQANQLKDIFEVTKKHKFKFSVFSLLDNLQTRYLAGYKYYWAPKSCKHLKNAAIYNLKNNIELFGIQEYYLETENMFKAYFNWISLDKKEKLRNTQIEKIVTEEDLNILTENHKIDIDIYKIAVELFLTRKYEILGE